MSNKHILLTGGHSGIGLELTKKLLMEDHKLGLIIRSEARQQQIMAEFHDVLQQDPTNIDFFYADLSDQRQVQSAAREIKNSWQKIDRLFNNAGIVSGRRKTSPQGNELQLEVNALAPVLLTRELKPLLLGSHNARVITTVTGGMAGRQLNLDKVFDENNDSGMMLYPQSKQAVMLLMNDMAKRDSWKGVTFVSVNPGANKTNANQSADKPRIIRFLTGVFFKDPSFGAQRLYNAAFDDRFANANAAFLANDRVVPVKHDLTLQDKDRLLARIQSTDTENGEDSTIEP